MCFVGSALLISREIAAWVYREIQCMSGVIGLERRLARIAPAPVSR